MKRCSEKVFGKIALRHGCSSVKLLHIFRTSIHENTSGGLLLKILLPCHSIYVDLISELFLLIGLPIFLGDENNKLKYNLLKNSVE